MNKTRVHPSLKFLLLLTLLLIYTGNVYASHGKSVSVRTSYVAIPVIGQAGEYTIAAKLNIPEPFESKAAVVIAHGSNGVDSRGRFHSATLNDAGFATLEVDLWAARGALDGSFQRPSAVHETLPDAFAALAYLAELPNIDSDKIGMLGFSWGGVMSMLSRESNLAAIMSPNYQFAAHVAFYPICWAYSAIPPYAITASTGAPISIQTGEKDDYDNPDSCQIWKDSLSPDEQTLVSIDVYKNAFHAFNTFAKPVIVTDPYSHLGQGGDVLMKANSKARRKSNKATIAFFKAHLVTP